MFCKSTYSCCIKSSFPHFYKNFSFLLETIYIRSTSLITFTYTGQALLVLTGRGRLVADFGQKRAEGKKQVERKVTSNKKSRTTDFFAWTDKEAELLLKKGGHGRKHRFGATQAKEANISVIVSRSIRSCQSRL